MLTSYAICIVTLNQITKQPKNPKGEKVKMETEQQGIVFKKSDGEWDSVPEGVHNCKVVDVEIGETKFGESTKFVLLTNQKDRNGGLMDIWAYASGSSPTPRNKLGRWIMAIMGVKNFKEIPESLTANQLMDSWYERR